MEAGWQRCDPACVRTSAAHGHQPTHTDCVVLSSGQRCGCSLPILEMLLYFLWWQRACTLVSGDGSVPEPLAGLEGRAGGAGLEGRARGAGLEGQGWNTQALGDLAALADQQPGEKQSLRSAWTQKAGKCGCPGTRTAASPPEPGDTRVLQSPPGSGHTRVL